MGRVRHSDIEPFAGVAVDVARWAQTIVAVAPAEAATIAVGAFVEAAASRLEAGPLSKI